MNPLASAIARFRNNPPAAAGQDNAFIAAMGLKLHDAQSCIAREYNFPSWTTLKDYVMWRTGNWPGDSAVAIWLHLLVYGHDGNHPRPHLGARMLEEAPHLAQGDLMLACAAGDEQAIRRAIDTDPRCVVRPAARFAPCRPCPRLPIHLLSACPRCAIAFTALSASCSMPERNPTNRFLTVSAR